MNRLVSRSDRSRPYRERSGFDIGRRSRGRNRQNHRAGPPHRPRDREWPREHHRDRQRHLHRKSRRRIEAPFPRSARGRREECGSGATSVALTCVGPLLDAAISQLEEAQISTIHGFCADLAPRTPGRSRVSILCSRSSPKPSRAACTRPPFNPGSRNSSPILPKGSSVLFGARSFPDSAPSPTRRKARSIDCGTPAGS